MPVRCISASVGPKHSHSCPSRECVRPSRMVAFSRRGMHATDRFHPDAAHQRPTLLSRSTSQPWLPLLRHMLPREPARLPPAHHRTRLDYASLHPNRVQAQSKRDQTHRLAADFRFLPHRHALPQRGQSDANTRVRRYHTHTPCVVCEDVALGASQDCRISHLSR